MRIVTFTTLYPSRARPHFSVFVENRLRYLVASGEVEARVVAPVPWFPFKAGRFGLYGAYARTPRSEVRCGVAVDHPRFPAVPRIGMAVAPVSLALSTLPTLKRLIRGGYDFDLIDAHYFYPDGVAAVMLGRLLGKPVVVTARGTDINLFPGYMIPRHYIRWAARSADGLITVSAALKDKLQSLEVPADKIRVLRNGVDLDLFRPRPQDWARQQIGAPAGLLLLCVGNLVELKGHDIAIRAVAALDNASLMIVGTGPEEARLKALVAQLGIARRVHFVGGIPHRELPLYYAAADALILASSREGMPNVVLESLATGTPVIGSDIPGMSELIGPPEAGRLIASRTPEALVETVRQLMADPPRRDATRAYAERFGWDATTKGQLELFREILASRS